MLLLKTAIKNILGAGNRTWLNVAVLSFTFVLMTLFNGIVDGWTNDAVVASRAWETGAGQFWHGEYDRYDIVTLQDAHGKRPETFTSCLSHQWLTPSLVSQAAAYEARQTQHVVRRVRQGEQRRRDHPSSRLSADE